MKIDFAASMMKLVCLIILALSLCVSRAALVSSNLFTLASVSNTTNAGAASSIGSVYIPDTTFNIQTVGTGGTNFGSGGNIYIGIDTNFSHQTLVGTYRATNDTIYGYKLTNGTVTLYATFQAFNTNSAAVQVGAQSIQQQ